MSAAKKVALAALTIGGLPAERFDTRRVKVTLADGITTTGVCRGVYKRFVLVDIVVDGRLRQHQVLPSKVKPFWTDNPDLHLEAKSLGILFDGDVNFGRALEMASDRASAEALAKAEALAAQTKEQPGVPPVQQAARQTETAAKAEAVIKASELFAEPEAPKPNYADITSVTANMTVDPTWVTDFADLQSLLAERKGRHGRIAALRAELVLLESSFEDDDEMIALYAESLLQKGATLHWDEPPAPAAGPRPGTFEARLTAWLATNPLRFTYQDVWDALGVGDAPVRRALICRLVGADYNILPSARGKPQLFARKGGPRG